MKHEQDQPENSTEILREIKTIFNENFSLKILFFYLFFLNFS
jgi:hypothetical protein